MQNNEDIIIDQATDSADSAVHTHTLPDGTTFSHRHDEEGFYASAEPGSTDGALSDHTHSHHGHSHGHTHSHTQRRAVINRLSRATGHLEAVRRMVENDRDCTDVLIQLSAVQSALSNTAKIILKDHIEHCMTDVITQGDKHALDDLNEAIEKFMR